MKLRELSAKFLRHETKVETRTYRKEDGTDEERTGPRSYFVTVETLAEAQGVEFLCPVCFEKNGGSVGTHGVICWFNNCGIPADLEPGPGRWNPSGNGIDDLTFVPPGAISVALRGGCNWHGFVRNGEATLS